MSNWIQGAIKNPGALHRDLGVPEGKTIPADKLAAKKKTLRDKEAAGTLSPSESKTLKRLNLAITLKNMHH